jgi:hypothetical protein
MEKIGRIKKAPPGIMIQFTILFRRCQFPPRQALFPAVSAAAAGQSPASPRRFTGGSPAVPRQFPSSPPAVPGSPRRSPGAPPAFHAAGHRQSLRQFSAIHGAVSLPGGGGKRLGALGCRSPGQTPPGRPCRRAAPWLLRQTQAGRPLAVRLRIFLRSSSPERRRYAPASSRRSTSSRVGMAGMAPRRSTQQAAEAQPKTA